MTINKYEYRCKHILREQSLYARITERVRNHVVLSLPEKVTFIVKLCNDHASVDSGPHSVSKNLAGEKKNIKILFLVKKLIDNPGALVAVIQWMHMA